MRSGRETLVSIDRAIQDARQQLQAADAAVQKTSTELAARRQREAELYARLARQRLTQGAEGIAGDLNAAGRRAQELLAKRESALTDLANATAAAQKRQTELEAAREARGQATAAAEAALDKCLATAEAALRERPEYRDKQAAYQHALEVAERAAAKTAQAEQDRQTKGRPYEGDPLFMYLWNRGYGTPRYRAWPPARFLDALVARHIRFEPARRNYYMLNEIPRRLRAHTERRQAAAEAAAAELDTLERSAAVEAGAVPLEEALAERRDELKKVDEEIAEAESRFTELMKQRQTFAAAEDRYYSEAVELLVTSLRAEPLQQLRREAESTPDAADDALVNELVDVQDRARALQESLADDSQLHERHLKRIRGLEDVRRQFKQRGFDGAPSQFDDSGRLDVMLGEYLRGMLTSEVLWRAISQAQIFRRTVQGGGWRGVPRPRLPRGRSFGGGGFRTGGGI